jgi:broad specificity phosphatase PhoE
MVWTSDEPKANETASVIALRRGLDLRVDARLAEVDRPSTWDEDYRALAVRYLMGEELPGWEPRESVVVRFAAAIVDAAAGGDGRDFVVVDHGLAFSLYAASVVGSALDIAGFWRALAFPDAWRMDLDTGALTRLFVVGRPPEQFEAVRE